ncbi:MAG: ATPases with chaperone activity, ATP-binding subunit [Parcubacteria group bacterium Gr01-1014_106]|nr:MAG: ATPases with chaperone activity, ATP-binding subunit [Parcubacteria group bacterium Gr01-1014_106]
MLARAVSRRERNNVFVSGAPGVGKSSLLHGLASRIAATGAAVPRLPMLRIESRQLIDIVRQKTPQTAMRVQRAFASLPPAIVVVDDFGRVIRESSRDPWALDDMLRPFTERRDLRLVGAVTPQDEQDVLETFPHLAKAFDVLRLSEPPRDDLVHIVQEALARCERLYRIVHHPTLAHTIVERSHEYPSDRALPDRALHLLDEACAHVRLQNEHRLTEDAIRAVIAERTGMPAVPAGEAGRAHLQRLDDTLHASIRGQGHAVTVVSDIVRRGWLGLRNPYRPIGSFLFLGPSGVGKTECAKVLAREVYGSDSALIRLDLSEYQEPHTVQRLLGAPPGYIGYDAGGQLTRPITARPFSLLLLDELEKADPSILDVFLQLLDDGRLTDGQGKTVDFTRAIVIATSNLAHRDIMKAVAAGEDVGSPAFLTQTLRPLLLQHLRPEFVNRFDAILVFRPLDAMTLADIGMLELQKLEMRFQQYGIRFTVSPDTLRAKAQELADPQFGARPLKRYLETLCERIVAERLFTTQAR